MKIFDNSSEVKLPRASMDVLPDRIGIVTRAVVMAEYVAKNEIKNRTVLNSRFMLDTKAPISFDDPVPTIEQSSNHIITQAIGNSAYNEPAMHNIVPDKQSLPVEDDDPMSLKNVRRLVENSFEDLEDKAA